jgi:hypothetical protein
MVRGTCYPGGRAIAVLARERWPQRTVDRLAEAAGMVRRQAERIYYGEHDCTIATIQRILDCMGATMLDFARVYERAGRDATARTQVRVRARARRRPPGPARPRAPAQVPGPAPVGGSSDREIESV